MTNNPHAYLKGLASSGVSKAKDVAARGVTVKAHSRKIPKSKKSGQRA